MATGSVQHPGRDVRQGGYEYQRQEDSWNGLPHVPGGGKTVVGGVQATDDRCRALLLGDIVCTGAVHGVRGGDGARVDGSPSTDAAQGGNRKYMTLGNHGP